MTEQNTDQITNKFYLPIIKLKCSAPQFPQFLVTISSIHTSEIENNSEKLRLQLSQTMFAIIKPIIV